MNAKPQATIGIRLAQMERLLRDIGHGPTAGAGAEARKAIGGGVNQQANTAGIPTISEALNAAGIAIAPVAAGQAWQQRWGVNAQFGSAQLKALLAVLINYLVTGAMGTPGYAKTIASAGVMARTDFGALFSQVPMRERFFLKANRGTWLNLVQQAAQSIMLIPPALDSPVFEAGLHHDYGMYRNDPRYRQNRLPELSRRTWLEGILDGTDYLTEAHYPTASKRDELQGLGSQGSKMDRSLGGAVPDAPIFELRGLPGNRPYGEWYGLAMDLFRYVRLVNEAGAGDYVSTKGDMNRQAALLGVSGKTERDDERLLQMAEAFAAINQWQ